MTRVLLDTDSGPFNDDGVALVMLARSPGITLEAVTLVPGNVWTHEGLVYTSRILKLLGKEKTPLAAGAQAPLVHTAAMAEEEHWRWGPLEWRGAFSTPSQPVDGGARHGVVLLIETVERAAGEITVLAIGPLTNLAIALRLRPSIASQIRQLVFMGGNITVPGNASAAAEFNFWFDPEAAQIVFRSAIPKKVMFGLDICNYAPLTKANFDAIVAARTPITELYREDFGLRYPGFLKDPQSSGFLWDELAAAWLLDPKVAGRGERRYLDVDTGFGPGYGAVVPLDRALAPDATPVEVMLEPDVGRAFGLYRDRMTA